MLGDKTWSGICGDNNIWNIYIMLSVSIKNSESVVNMTNHKSILIKLHKTHDENVLKKLSEVSNKQGYIKDLIIQDPLVYKNYKKGEQNG